MASTVLIPDLVHGVRHLAGQGDSLAWTAIHATGPAVNRPVASAANAGYLYFQTDTGRGLYISDGLTWTLTSSVGGQSTNYIGFGAVTGQTVPPSALGTGPFAAGDFWSDANGVTYTYDGVSTWSPAGHNLVGVANGIAPLGPGAKVAPYYLGSIAGGLTRDASVVLRGDGSFGAAPGGLTDYADVTLAPYFADNTGGTDCSAAFAAALAANDAIWVPAGNYIFDAPIGVFTTAKKIIGSGFSSTFFITTQNYHNNHPGEFLLAFRGQGLPSNPNILLSSSPITAAGNYTLTWGTASITGSEPLLKDGTHYSGAMACGYPGPAQAAVKFTLGNLTGTGAATATIEESNDPTFATGVTTSGTVTFTQADANTVKQFNSTSVAAYTHRYIRVRLGITGTPTSWAITCTLVASGTLLNGTWLEGFQINGPSNTSGVTNDWARWNSSGILLDRAKFVTIKNVWINKQQQGITALEMWDSYWSNVKIMKCGQSGNGQGDSSLGLAAGAATNLPLYPAVQLLPFNEFDYNSNSNNSTFVQVHHEDNKYTQLYIGRHGRRLRFLGCKWHGDLASNSIMTIAPHIRLESAFTNQWVGCSFNRAGQSHMEFDQHNIEFADPNVSPYSYGGDYNTFSSVFFDGSGTNTTLGDPTKGAIRIIYGRSNTWSACTFSQNTKEFVVDTNAFNDENTFDLSCQFRDTFGGNPPTNTATITSKITGNMYGWWRRADTAALYYLDGTTLVPMPSSAAPAGSGIPLSTVTAKGDLIVGTASGAVARLASAAGVLTSDSSGNVSWGSASTTASAGQELAQVTYRPNAAQTNASQASSTLADISAAAITAAWSGVAAGTFDLTFTVPASGAVIVRGSAWLSESAAGTTTNFALYQTSGTPGAVANTTDHVHQGTVQGRGLYDIRISGLTPGGSLTYRPQWSSTATSTLYVGGTNGGFRFQVLATT